MTGKLLPLILGIAMVMGAPAATAQTLPDGRAYELVTPPDKNGVTISVIDSAPSGNLVDWVAPGGCCGATTGNEELYQSQRGSDGWTTRGVTPTPTRNLEGLFEEQAPVFWTPDLGETIYNTVESYDPGDVDNGALDLYLSAGSGAPIWLSQGPFGGSAHDGVTFDGATSDASTVVFSTREQLTADATGLDSNLVTAPEYLYARNVATATTSLVNVTNGDTVVSPYGAILGDGNYLGSGVTAPDQMGSTSNAVSSDGTKVFFESPPSRLEGLGAVEPQPHLYMRNLADGTTTPLDDPAVSGFARYEGASEDGSLVFFTSTEALAGDPNTDLELYEFNTTTHPIGLAPPMSAIPISAGSSGEPALDGHVLGATAISNDGSHVYFIAEGVLTGAPNGGHVSAVANRPNLYVYDTSTGRTAFVTTLASEGATELTREPDRTRPAVPTPDGSVLVFETNDDVTGENPPGPNTMLTAEASVQASSLTVESTTGLIAGREIEIGSGPNAERNAIKTVVNGTEITLDRPLRSSFDEGVTVDQLGVSDIYRYSTTDGSIVCISCTSPGVVPNGSSFLTGAGGTYGPQGSGLTMSADGSRIFFMTTEALVPEDENGNTLDVYEWEDGHRYIVSDGKTLNFSFLFGTTPTGNDVFIATAARLVPQDTDGYFDTYDVRVGGGFPAPVVQSETCLEAGCRVATPPNIFAAIPGSATLLDQGESIPEEAAITFKVKGITAAQRAIFAKTGRLTLAVAATGQGQITARALAKLHSKLQPVASAGASLSSSSGWRSVTLRLSRAARTVLTRRGQLSLKLEISYSGSSDVRVTRIMLTRRSSHSTKRNSGLSVWHLGLRRPVFDQQRLLP